MHTHRARYDDITKVPSPLYGIAALQHYRSDMWGVSNVPGFIYNAKQMTNI